MVLSNTRKGVSSQQLLTVEGRGKQEEELDPKGMWKGRVKNKGQGEQA